MGEIETVEAEKMGWLDLPRGTSYPTFPYLFIKVRGDNFYYFEIAVATRKPSADVGSSIVRYPIPGPAEL